MAKPFSSPMSMSVHRLLSVCTIATVGFACKAFLRLGFCKSVKVSGLGHLLDALDDAERKNGRGIVTVSNHISTLDDPLTWGILPARYYFKLRDMRWVLGASDIMFTNPVFSAFFRKGQVLETFRGQGVFQPALDCAIKKLDQGGWVHLFGEGKVNQPYQYELLKPTKGIGASTKEGLVARLPRFKWGTGRIVAEAQRLPLIIPMWLSGFENVMPEPRPKGFPAKFLPGLRQSLSITFAPPLDDASIREALAAVRSPMPTIDVHGKDHTMHPPDSPEKRRVREALTAVLQRTVEQLGYATTGPLLGCSEEAATGPRAFHPRP
ncbi:TAZ1 [Sanghuangporus sanghuang]